MNGLRARRKALGLRQQDLCKEIGITQGQLSKYELGTQEPRVMTALRIAEVLGTTVERLFSPREL